MEHGQKNILYFAAALFVVAVWGETFVSSKIVIGNGLGPAEIFFYRFLIAYAGIWFFSPKKLWADSPGDEGISALLGITGGSLYFLAENTALLYSTASNVAILVCCAPLLTALMVSILYREERMHARQVLGSVLAFFGMAMVVLNGKLILRLNPAGDLLALAAALLWSIYSLLYKRISDRYDVTFITRKVFAYGLLTILPYIFFVQPFEKDLSVLARPAVWGNLLYLGLVASLLCFILWNRVLVKLGTVRTTNLLYAQPLFTMLAGFVALHERITWMAVSGTFLVILGTMRASRK